MDDLARTYGNEVDRPVAELPFVIQRIDQAFDRITTITNRLANHADRIYGASPTALQSGSGGATPQPTALIAELQQKLEALHSVISRLEDEAERNTRLA